MTIVRLRSFLAISVVLLHVVLIIGSAILLRFYVTDFATYVSALAVFFPVFGAYVGIVLQDLGPHREKNKRKASSTFAFVVIILLISYVIGVGLVLFGYTSGFLISEEALPAAIAAVEAAFGTFLTTCFFKLFRKPAE